MIQIVVTRMREKALTDEEDEKLWHQQQKIV
jgi:hypothetical protein